MTDLGSAISLQDINTTCWKRAIEILRQTHNASLKKGHLSKRHINAEGLGDFHISASTLIITAMGSYEKLKTKRGRFANIFKGVRQALSTYSRAIDTFIQSDPNVSGLVWGSIRLLLQTMEQEEAATQTAGEGIIEILNHVERWEAVSLISQILDSHSVLNAVVMLYTKILDFLLSSTKWISKSSFGRFGVSLLRPKAAKFEEKLKQLRLASDLVDKEIETRATHEELRALKDIRIRAVESADKIEQVLDCVNHIPETIHAQTQTLQDTLRLADVKRWLAPTGPGSSRLSSHPTPGTCQWLLRHPTFVNWAAGEEHPALWLHGPSGCGKSVMAGYLYEHFFDQDEKVVFYRFQRPASDTHSTPVALTGSLISQVLEDLATAVPRYTLDSLFRLAQQPLHQCSFRKVWDIATSLLLQSSSKYILIIDAMDECWFRGSSLPSVTEFIKCIFEVTQRAKCRAVLFARPEPKFKMAIAASSSISMNENHLLPDIMTFATRQYELLNLSKDEQDSAMERIRSCSRGSFQWAQMFLDHLGQACGKGDFQARLCAIPPTLEHLYKLALLETARGFVDAQMECRRVLLQLIFGASRTLTISELTSLLSLPPERAETIVYDLCRPLISVEGHFVQFSHPSLRDFFEEYDSRRDLWLGFSFSEAHALIAEKCLRLLLHEKYENLQWIGEYLESNFGETDNHEEYSLEDDFYDYASKFWSYHLTKANLPGIELLQLADSFMASLQFVFWAEYCTKELGGQSAIVVRVLNDLTQWHSQLPDKSRAAIDLSKYAEQPYERVSSACLEEGGAAHSWLALMGLGEFYFNMVYYKQIFPLRARISAGLNGLLGPRHRLSLSARGKFAYAHFYVGKMRVARRIYTDVIRIQKEVLGPRSRDVLESRVFYAESKYYMADFAAAAKDFARLAEEWKPVTGLDSWQHNATQMWHAVSLGQLGKLDRALRMLRGIYEKRRDQFGENDTFATGVQVAMAEVLQLLGKQQEAIDHFQAALVERRGRHTMSDILRLDVEIALAGAYLAAGMNDSALEILDEIDRQVSDFTTLFPRLCKITHIRGLLLAKQAGNSVGSIQMDEAIILLQGALIQTEPDQNNRMLLWIRLDLADMLRSRNNEGDSELASALFDNIVKDVSGENEPGFPDEPDPPKFLAAAEEALRLLRVRKHTEARQALNAANVDWRRPSDLWLSLGGGFFP